MKSPIVGGEMYRSSSDTLPILNGWLHDRRFAVCLAKRVRLQFVIVGQHALPKARAVPERPVLEFVMLKIAFEQIRPLLENNHIKPCCREFLRSYSASGTRADHNEINCRTGLESFHP